MKPTKTQQRIRDQIEKTNKAFRASTPAQKRVMVAKDLLQRVRQGQYIARTGAWAIIHGIQSEFLVDDKQSIQKLLVEDNKKCECCAIGGILLSCVAIKNRVNVEDDAIRDIFAYSNLETGDIQDKTGAIRLFGKKQLAMIEVAYEFGDGYFSRANQNQFRYMAEKEYTQCKSFGFKAPKATERLIRIANNIIANNGTFVP